MLFLTAKLISSSQQFCHSRPQCLRVWECARLLYMGRECNFVSNPSKSRMLVAVVMLCAPD